jgi:hypothetical protein
VKIYGGELSDEEVDAALEVMKGEFGTDKVIKALRQAGVSDVIAATDALIRRELRCGRIRRVAPGRYRQT